MPFELKIFAELCLKILNTGQAMNQTDVLNIIVTTAGSIGLLSSCYLCYFLYRNHRMLRNPTGRLIISIAFCDIINGTFKLIGRNWIGKGLLCSFQAFILQQFSLSEWILCTLIAGYSVLIVCYGKSINYFKKTEGLFLALSFLAPLPFSISVVALNIIGDAQLYCWISSSESSIYQLYLYTIPILTLMAINLYCISAVSIVSHKYGQSNIWGETVTYKKYLMIRFFGYQLLFWGSYLPTILNRLTVTAIGQEVFPLLILQATISPLQGTLHLAILLYIWEFNPIRETVQQEYEEMNIFSLRSRDQSENGTVNQAVATDSDLPTGNSMPLVERNVSVNVMDMEQSSFLNIVQIGSSAKTAE